MLIVHQLVELMAIVVHKDKHHVVACVVTMDRRVSIMIDVILRIMCVETTVVLIMKNARMVCIVHQKIVRLCFFIVN